MTKPRGNADNRIYDVYPDQRGAAKGKSATSAA
jgi:hypothetical protein